MRIIIAAAVVAVSLCGPSSGSAASLRVAPVIVDLSAPTATSHIRLWNDAAKPINVQVRVFRWRQENGQDVLVPAEQVVASPPITTLKAGGENLVRIVRTSKQPVRGEESYRLIVDELPNAGRQAATVVMVVRHSIPLFFSQDTATDPKLEWRVRRASGGYELTVINKGDRRLKVSDLALKSGNQTFARRGGLVGYVLGGSSVSWFVPGEKIGNGSVTVTGQNEGGGFDAKVALK